MPYTAPPRFDPPAMTHPSPSPPPAAAPSRFAAYRAEVIAALALAWPVALSQLGQVSLGFVDTLMVGRLGPDALASVALGGAVFFTTILMGMGVVAAVGPMVSQAFGAGEVEPVGRSTRQGLWLGLIMAVPAMVLLAFVEPFFLAIGQDPGAARGAQAYLRAIIWGIPAVFWFMALRSYLEGLGRPRAVTAIVFAGVLVNVAANYVLMYGKLGAPALGIVGTGIASSLVYWCEFMLLAAYVRARPALRVHAVFVGLRRPDPTYLRELIRIGWPIGGSYGLEAGLFSATALLMGILGTTELAAHQIALQSAAFTFMVPLGIGIATSVRVGQAVGRGDAEAARRSGVVGIGLSAAFMACAALVFFLAPRFVIALYIDVDQAANATVAALAATLLAYAATFQIFDGVQVSAAGALRGYKDTRRPMLLNLFAYWCIGLPVGVWLGFRTDLGPRGLWLGLVCALATASVMLTTRFLRQTSAGREGRDISGAQHR